MNPAPTDISSFQSVKVFITSLVKRLISVICRRQWTLALAVGVSFIVLGVGLGWYNNKIMLPNPAPIAHYIGEPGNKLSFMSNWDGPNYIHIAKQGYTSAGSTNFFPLYPLLIRLFHQLIPSWLISGLVISWIGVCVAIFFYMKILKQLFQVDSSEDLFQGVLLLLLFPTAVFFLATYTESLFAALALGAIYYALKKQWLVSAILLAFCTATHITSAFVVLLVAIILIEERVKLSKIILSIVIGALGLLGFMYYLLHKFQKPFAFITEQKKHGWLVSNGLGSFFNTMDFYNVIFIGLLIAAIIYWWNRRKSLSIYSFLFLLIPIVGKQFGGFNRYVLMAFPIPLMIYGWTLARKQVYYTVVVALFAISWTYFLFQYAGGYIGG
ncbi:MAG TPA: mannosyltransferase family protein [Candidatus Saccharimonadales bacterium]|nr:mannosyltransferase family protein [Candidatus Saccharimonadales bacterium]